MDNKPPRFMVVLVDFKTNAQIQVGAPNMNDFLKPIKDGKKGETFELERVITHFKKTVRKMEKDPWAVKSKGAQEAELVETLNKGK